MKKAPIALIVDDSAPFISTPYVNREPKVTADGRPLIRFVPNELVFRFADTIEKNGIKGKFSIVPMAGNQGDIINGFDGIEKSEVDEWLDCVRDRIYPAFSICPEILSHCKAVDIETGKPLAEREDEWSFLQDRTTLTPYIEKAFSLIKEAGFDSHGVTSPWYFGIEVEGEYTASISQALYNVYGYKNAYYFLHSRRGVAEAKPWIAYEEGDRCVISVPATIRDHIWQTMDTPESGEEFAKRVADNYITEDGKSGDIIKALELGAYPILCTHWQSLCSNGTLTGVRALDLVGQRIKEHLSDRVEWVSFEELLDRVIADKDSFRTVYQKA